MNGPENSSVVGRKQNERVGESGEMKEKRAALTSNRPCHQGLVSSGWSSVSQNPHDLHLPNRTRRVVPSQPYQIRQLYFIKRLRDRNWANDHLLEPSQSMHQENRFKVQISAPASLIDE